MVDTAVALAAAAVDETAEDEDGHEDYRQQHLPGDENAGPGSVADRATYENTDSSS